MTDNTTHTDALADDLASWKSREPLPSGPLADALERIETDTMVDYGLRTIHGENVLAMAAARLRSLEARALAEHEKWASEVERHGLTFEKFSQAEAQRDEAVALMRRATDDAVRVNGNMSLIDPEIIDAFCAFLDSLKEGR